MNYLSRQAIIEADDLKTEDVAVPEWGGTVRVRTMTGEARDKLGAAMIGPNGRPDRGKFNLMLVAGSMVDENGDPLFGFDEVAELGKKSAQALQRVADVAFRLNGLGEEQVKAAEGN
ncbi:MAG TPA: hypothetical protein PLL72_06755 [Burkholderiaceae bacterium]|nr:hypothetical protein [Burkholderiaceae bacterium]